MNAAPAVSVVMPVYNAERYVAEATESILTQTFEDFEFIIIDDGSTDGSHDILKQHAEQDERIRLISRPNTGIVGALNDGLALARGEFLARMDGDDISVPHRFERQVGYLLQHPECLAVSSRVVLIDPEGNQLAVRGVPLTHEEIDEGLINARGQLFFHAAAIFRKAAMIQVGGYRERYAFVEDLDLLLRLGEIGRLINVSEPLYLVRQHMASICHTRSNEQIPIIKQIIAEARQRRGVTCLDEVVVDTVRPLSAAERSRTWAWWALGAGNVKTARKHAFAALRRAPISIESWRVAYCALRGY